MDLFNPPKLFNYKTMSHKLDVSKLDNPYVQVYQNSGGNLTIVAAGTFVKAVKLN